MKCKCGCNNEVVSEGTKPKLFYSDACRKRYNRTNLQEQTDKRTESQVDEYKRTEEADKPEQPTIEDSIGDAFDDVAELYNHNAPSLEHYQACPDRYAQRTTPEALNWGPWMNLVELDASPFTANRVAIPGDWDYKGVAG